MKRTATVSPVLGESHIWQDDTSKQLGSSVISLKSLLLYSAYNSNGSSRVTSPDFSPVYPTIRILTEVQKILEEESKNSLGSLLTPLNAQISALQLNKLIASEKEVVSYLISRNRSVSEAEVIKQPTPLGLALIANYYEKKGDQITKIYVASTIEDLKIIITKIGRGKYDAKAIVIFQPTDNNGKWKDSFDMLHKAMVYLEKKDSTLHMVIADSAPYEPARKFCMLLAEQSSPDITKVYYTQEIVRIAHTGHRMCLQTDYWNCGTHAFRIARKIAKNRNFLDNIQIINNTRLYVDDFLVANLIYRIPASFAKCADADISKKRCKEYYSGPTLTALEAHFARYPEKHSYIKKFTYKYINILMQEFLNNSQEELISSIANVNAKNYGSDRGPQGLCRKF